jgi:hypothetical protein
MTNEIENVFTLINGSMIPANIFPSDNEFIQVWVPMVIDSDEEDEVLESEEEEDEESDIDEDEFDDEGDLDDNNEDADGET